MTNFSSNSSQQKKWINPESAAFFAPVLFGAFMSSLVVIFALLPAATKLYDRHLQLQLSKKKVSEIPELEQRLYRLQRTYSKNLRAHKRLFLLLAGANTPRTFLAEINRLAILQNVSILDVTPLAREVYVPPSQPPKEKTSNPPLIKAADPLLIQNVEKRTFSITFQAPFTRLLGLIRMLEELDSIVVVGDSHFEAVKPSAPPRDNIILTKLKVTLVLYGRTPSGS